MAIITKIAEQKRRPRRRNVYLDGRFAFGCHVNVIARFRLKTGMELSADQLERIERGEIRQACFDKALSYLQTRLHSRFELSQKLMQREFGRRIVDGVLDELERLGYVDDARFAQARASASVRNKHHGRRRAMMELLKAGVQTDVAERALGEVYDQVDAVAMARDLAMKQAPRLRRLDPAVARRRLAGMLQRRGFGYPEIGAVIDEVLGSECRNSNDE